MNIMGSPSFVFSLMDALDRDCLSCLDRSLMSGDLDLLQEFSIIRDVKIELELTLLAMEE